MKQKKVIEKNIRQSRNKYLKSFWESHFADSSVLMWCLNDSDKSIEEGTPCFYIGSMYTLQKSLVFSNPH